jgi:hypothetical protein
MEIGSFHGFLSVCSVYSPFPSGGKAAISISSYCIILFFQLELAIKPRRNHRPCGFIFVPPLRCRFVNDPLHIGKRKENMLR